MRIAKKESNLMTRKTQVGFTLLETMVSLVILLGVSAVIMSGLVQMMKTQGTIVNRTEMHTSVRAATELLQQEIGQAGKISLPTPPLGGWQLVLGVAAGATPDAPITTVASFTPGMNLYEGEWVTVDTNIQKETVQLKCPVGIGACPIGTNAWRATFTWPHLPGVPASVQGAFSTGIVPPAVPAVPGALSNIPPGYAGYPMFPATYPFGNAPAQGSTGTVLKLYGDVNGDGNMVYVEYTCVQGTQAAPGFVYRNQVPWTANAIPPNDPTMIVLTGVLANPNDANGNPVPCFKYQLQTSGGVNAAANDLAFVTDVAVTLTVQTPNKDPQIAQFQTETKALLNVSPRNVYDAYLSAVFDYTNRVQPMPLNIKGTILPNYP
jgi:type II secretory pathway pseudopilin PulG